MVSRRRLLAAAPLLPLALRAATLRAAAEEAQSTLPPPLAALKDRRHEAAPITLGEREASYERAQKLMAGHELAAIVLAGGTSLRYFTGIRWGNSERLFAFVLPRAGAPFCVCPAFEEDRARELMPDVPHGDSLRIYAWQEDEDPYALVRQGLNALGLRTGKIGIEETVPFVFSEGIRRAAAAFEIASATPVTAGCRAVKSTAEIALMRLANQVTLSVYKAVYESLQPGVTNREVSAWISRAYDRIGFPGDASCEVDAYSALPHGSIHPQTINEGSLVVVDDGCDVLGYQSDITRSWLVGRPAAAKYDRVRKVFDTVHRAQAAALAAARPGTAAGAVDAAARKVIEEAGFGSGYTHFYHRVGHGIGMDVHEWPYLVKGNPALLEAGMTFSDEPGIYLRGEFGLRLEDILLVTPQGAELLTQPSADLDHPFGV